MSKTGLGIVEFEQLGDLLGNGDVTLASDLTTVSRIGNTGLRLVERVEERPADHQGPSIELVVDLDDDPQTYGVSMAGLAGVLEDEFDEIVPRRAQPKVQPSRSEYQDLSALRQMLDNSKRAPLLRSTEKERALAIRIERGDMAARDQLFEANMRLAVSIAERYQGIDLDMEDLVQEGLDGLLVAVHKFDYRKMIAFSTFATFWIKQRISLAVANDSRSIRLPKDKHLLYKRLQKASDILQLDLGVEPNIEQIADFLGISVQRAKAIDMEGLRASSICSLDAPLPTGDGGILSISDAYADRSADTAREAIRRIELDQILVQSTKLLAYLDKVEVDILRYRFGFETGQEQTWEEVAIYFGDGSATAYRKRAYKSLEKIRDKLAAGEV